MEKIKNISILVGICVLFSLITILWTYPLIFKLKTGIFADANWLFDTLTAIYGIWLNKMAWLGQIPFDFNNLLGYPFGVDLSHINREPALEIPLLALSLWRNEIFAFNIVILTSFLFSAITMYVLGFYFTKNRTASFISAIIYAFCPYHSLQSFSHMSLAVIQWLPLYVFVLFKFGDKISYTRSALSAGVFLLLALSNYYYAYVMFIFTLIFFIFNGYKTFRIGIKEMFNFIKKSLLMGFVITAVLVPLNYKAVMAIWKGADYSEEISVARHAPPFQDLFRYSASISDYIRPSEYHPIFGKVDFWFIKPYANPSRHWAEKTVFLGYVPLILFLYYTFSHLSVREKRNGNIYILFIATITAFIISLPPKIWFLPMPSFFLYKILPMFRSYARFGVLVILGIAVFAGLGFVNMLKKYKQKQLFTYSIIGLILFEFIVLPPFRTVDFTKIPQVYEFIKGLPNKEPVVEYPLLSEIDSDHYKYLFYHRIHKHPLFNGCRINTIGDAITQNVRDITNPKSVRVLKCLGIRYVVLHKEKYSKSELETITGNNGLKAIKDCGDSVIYEVMGISSEVEKLYLKNFYDSEKWNDGNYWRWAGNNSSIWIWNPGNGPVQFVFNLSILSFKREREMDVYFNDTLIDKVTILCPQSLNDVQKNKYTLLLKHGANILRFYTPQGSDMIDSNNDRRQVCFGFRDEK